MSDPIGMALLEEAYAALSRLAEVWPWLGDAQQPSTGWRRPVPLRRITDREQAARWRNAAHDRAAAREAVRHRRVPSGHHPAPVQIGALAARLDIADRLGVLVEYLHGLLTGGEPYPWPAKDPADRPITIGCPHCGAAGYLPTFGALPPDWPEHVPAPPAVACPSCHGRGQVPAGVPCTICQTTGPCGCTPADQRAIIALRALPAMLEQLAALPGNTDPAGYAVAVIDSADRHARAVLNLGEERRYLPGARCPACGLRGDLYAEVSNPDRSRWIVRCGNPDCTCTGPTCPCRRPVAYPGRRHMWPAAEWTTLAGRLGDPTGLADLLTPPGSAA